MKILCGFVVLNDKEMIHCKEYNFNVDFVFQPRFIKYSYGFLMYRNSLRITNSFAAKL